MTNLKGILKFGWPYLKRYRTRLITGMLLGFLYGLSNASFVWATKTLFDRLAPSVVASGTFTANSITNIDLLEARLRQPPAGDAVSAWLASQLSTYTSNLLQTETAASSVLRDALIVDLNHAVQTSSLYDETRFHGVRLSPESTALLAQNPQGTNLVRLNRLLLQDAFPKELPGPAGDADSGSLKLVAKRLQSSLSAALDAWLPLRGRPLDARQILGALLLLPIMVAVRGIVSYLSAYCMMWVSERVIRDVRLDVFAKLNSLSMDFFDRSSTGELLGRVNGDSAALYQCMRIGFTDLIKEPITVVSLLAALLWTDWQLTLVSVVFVPFIIIPIRVLSKKAKHAFRSGMSAAISQDSLLVEIFKSIRIVKAFCLEKFQIERIREIYHRLLHTGMKGVQSRELINPLIEVISVLGFGVVIVFIFYAHKDVSKMVGFLTGVMLMYAPIKKLGSMPILFQQALVGAERLIHIFNEQPSVVEKSDAVRLQKFSGELTFENVTFAYGDKPVLRDFTLNIPRGFRLGIAGESGSGKSTLVNLIFRFYDPVSGSIKIDGHNLRDVSVSDLRHQLALVSQDIVLFDRTVAENIALGRPGATQAEIEAAARASFAHDFIMQLPKGYDTGIGEAGKLLAGGQRQRISIARAFVRNAPILVLDEATANLDSNAEAEVQAAVDRLIEARTVVCIAHRLSTLANTDKIIVLAEGRIVEQGTYKELLGSGGVFAGMAHKQGIIHQGDSNR